MKNLLKNEMTLQAYYTTENVLMTHIDFFADVYDVENDKYVYGL